MAKRLAFTEKSVEEMIESLRRRIGEVIPSGGINLARSALQNEKARINFSANAYAKICSLVQQYSTEVQWEGFVVRQDKNVFFIKDIMVYPHEVTGSTVTSDQAEYEAWLDSLTDEQIAEKHFHGHSHVNMGVTPSGVDMKYREDRLEALPKAGIPGNDSFLVFMIMNKRSEMEFQIYDVENNVMYECADITYDIVTSDGETMSEFIADARTKTKIKTYTAPATTSYSGVNYYGNRVNDTKNSVKTDVGVDEITRRAREIHLESKNPPKKDCHLDYESEYLSTYDC